MTYFHRRMPTIIGAKAFHDPVRDGKAWDHLAMVVKRNGLPDGGMGADRANLKKHTRVIAVNVGDKRFVIGCARCTMGGAPGDHICIRHLNSL